MNYQSLHMDVSIILINYNTAKYTLNCLDSLKEHIKTTVSYEIIVVDNNSEPEDYTFLSKGLEKKPSIQLVRNSINSGFGSGNMLGAKYAKGNYLLFINNDVILKNDVINISYTYMHNNPRVGVCTAQNFDEHNNFIPSFDHYKGLRKLIFGRGFLESVNPLKYPKRKKQHKNPLEVNFINGAFMFFRRSTFDLVGGFDPNIFLYFEEMDICYRMRCKGFASVLLPSAKIIHFQGASTKKSKDLYKEGFISYLYVLKKNYSYIKYISVIIYLSFTFLIKPKKWGLLAIVIKGGDLSKSLRNKQLRRH